MTNASDHQQTSNASVAKSEIYYFASASKRILVRFFDALFLCFVYILFAFFYYFLCNPHQNVISSMMNTTWWQLDWYVVIIFCANFGYFIVLPFFWKGQTLFHKFFKTQIISVTRKHFFGGLILRELFVWINFSLLFLLILIVLSFCYPTQSVNKLIRQVATQDTKATLLVQIISWAFKVLSICLVLIGIFIFGNTIFNSHYQTIYDLKTNTAVVFVKKSKPKLKQQPTNPPQPTHHVDLPGKIRNGSLANLD